MVEGHQKKTKGAQNVQKSATPAKFWRKEPLSKAQTPRKFTKYAKRWTAKVPTLCTLAHAKSAKVNMWVNPPNPSPGDIPDTNRRSKIK